MKSVISDLLLALDSEISVKKSSILFVVPAILLCFNANAANTFEAIAKVQETTGFQTSHNIGMSFQSIDDCESEVAKLNLAIGNLTLQGVLPSSKPMVFECVENQHFQLSMKN